MDGREFYEKIDAHPDLEYLGSKLGVSPREDRVFVGCHTGGGGTNGVRFEISPAAILDPKTTWEDLEPVLTGRRPVRVLGHMSRIVGYYSPVRCWNRSKHAELADRQRGEYVVPVRAEPWPAGLAGVKGRVA